jgi:hypothetical protein
MARVPEALDWLDSVRLPQAAARRPHPSDLHRDRTNKPLYVHRRGSNVVNGAYYVDGDPNDTVIHAGGFRKRAFRPEPTSTTWVS